MGNRLLDLIGRAGTVFGEPARAWRERQRRNAEKWDWRTWIEEDRRVVMKGKKRCEIALEDIDEVVSYKTDNITIDTVWVGIFAGGLYYEINEGWGGFWETVNRLMDLLGGDVNWRGKVVLPGFEECRTVIFRRGDAP